MENAEKGLRLLHEHSVISSRLRDLDSKYSDSVRNLKLEHSKRVNTLNSELTRLDTEVEELYRKVLGSPMPNHVRGSSPDPLSPTEDRPRMFSRSEIRPFKLSSDQHGSNSLPCSDPTSHNPSCRCWISAIVREQDKMKEARNQDSQEYVSSMGSCPISPASHTQPLPLNLQSSTIVVVDSCNTRSGINEEIKFGRSKESSTNDKACQSEPVLITPIRAHDEAQRSASNVKHFFDRLPAQWGWDHSIFRNHDQHPVSAQTGEVASAEALNSSISHKSSTNNLAEQCQWSPTRGLQRSTVYSTAV